MPASHFVYSVYNPHELGGSHGVLVEDIVILLSSDEFGPSCVNDARFVRCSRIVERHCWFV